MENKRLYLPLQIKVLMPESMYKAIDILFALQKDGMVGYSSRTAELAHIDSTIADQAIQTAINHKIFIPIGKENGIYRFRLNEDVLKKSLTVDFRDLTGYNLIELATDIKFKESVPESSDEMTEDEMKAQILMLQAKLKEKRAVKKLLSSNTQEYSDLPF